MSTILWQGIVFGPVKSRRLGNSLGVNLMPANGKVCSFDCIYCECGWNKNGKDNQTIPTLEAVKNALTSQLEKHKGEGTAIDTITFSGNGEPTLHPQFPNIIEHTIQERNRLFPNAKVSVLSNATRIGEPAIREALKRVDNPILKIDSALEEWVKLIDNPAAGYSLKKTIENLKLFNGNFVLQTMFLRGEQNGIKFDSTEAVNTEPWIGLVRELKPREIMMYTIDRETPNSTLKKVTVEEMERIAKPLVDDGFFVQIKG